MNIHSTGMLLSPKKEKSNQCISPKKPDPFPYIIPNPTIQKKKEPTIKADLEKDNEVPEEAETTPEKNISKEDELVTEGTTFQEILVGKEGNIEDILRDFHKARVYKDIQEYYRVIPKTDILMTVEHNLVGTEILRIITSDLKIFILIKGSTFIRMRQATEELYIISGAANGSPLPDFDYIGYFHPLDETIIIAPNPFR